MVSEMMSGVKTIGQASGEVHTIGIEPFRNRIRGFFQFFEKSRRDSQKVNTSEGFDLSNLKTSGMLKKCGGFRIIKDARF